MFFLKVYNLVKHVSYGRVTTYSAIVRYLGSSGAARTVGWSLNASHQTQWDIPEHRVVNY
ncbi:MGMT family protein [Bacteroidetes bacterium endosymbiont of Geopemphigus sp.]|uniref:MGMT family protein n=1 Tax=Bacteroidetes bacterium endosymbiont of Geopemphigus sp. TaxID=2047937 RepID=UPI00321AB3E5